MRRLTKEQAIILSGSTGVTCCPLGDLHADVERRLGKLLPRNVLGDPDMVDLLRSVYREDFERIAYRGEIDDPSQQCPKCGGTGKVDVFLTSIGETVPDCICMECCGKGNCGKE